MVQSKYVDSFWKLKGLINEQLNEWKESVMIIEGVFLSLIFRYNYFEISLKRLRAFYLSLLPIIAINMFNPNVLQQLPVKVILIVLLILEGACIAFTSRMNFDDYITIVLIILTGFIAYFAYHYLKPIYLQTKYFEAINQVTPAQQLRTNTERQVEKLVKSEEYKIFEQRWRNKQLLKASGKEKGESDEQDQNKTEDIQRVIEELLENEDKIFDQ